MQLDSVISATGVYGAAALLLMTSCTAGELLAPQEMGNLRLVCCSARVSPLLDCLYAFHRPKTTKTH
jgi:hypothetical protein